MATVFPHAEERRRIEDELIEVARYARRQPRIIGTAEYPTKWDSAHEYLDALLDDYQQARAVELTR